jgi:type II secretion system protein C
MKRILMGLIILLFFARCYAEQPPFKLLATVIEPALDKSTCVIMNLETKKQISCRLLDKIEGYQIVKIIRGSVKLLKDGKLYALDFPLGNENKGISYDAITINRQDILKKISEPSVLLTQGMPIPCIESGKIIGFKIPGLKDKALLEMAGLAEGDIATKVNGERLNSIPKAIELYNKYKNQNEINLEVKRGDITKSFTYFIN